MDSSIAIQNHISFLATKLKQSLVKDLSNYKHTYRHHDDNFRNELRNHVKLYNQAVSFQHMMLMEDYYIHVEETRHDELKDMRNTNKWNSVLSGMIGKYAVGFLNSEGGRLWFGIQNDGIIKGIFLSTQLKDEIRLGVDHVMSQCCVPAVTPDLYSLHFIPVLGAYERYVIVLEINNTRQPCGCYPALYSYKSHTYMRFEASTRMLDTRSIEMRSPFAQTRQHDLFHITQRPTQPQTRFETSTYMLDPSFTQSQQHFFLHTTAQQTQVQVQVQTPFLHSPVSYASPPLQHNSHSHSHSYSYTHTHTHTHPTTHRYHPYHVPVKNSVLTF